MVPCDPAISGTAIRVAGPIRAERLNDEPSAECLWDASEPRVWALGLFVGVVAVPSRDRTLAHRTPRRSWPLGAAPHAGRAEQYVHAQGRSRAGPGLRAPRLANLGEPVVAATRSSDRSEPSGLGVADAVSALYDGHGPAPHLRSRDGDPGHAEQCSLCLPLDGLPLGQSVWADLPPDPGQLPSADRVDAGEGAGHRDRRPDESHDVFQLHDLDHLGVWRCPPD